MTLPLLLQEGLEGLLAGHKHAALREARAHLTQTYHTQGAPHMVSEEERLSYLATRMPATFEVARAVLAQVPGLEDGVGRLLDLGAGPGTVLWALESLTHVARAVLVEQDKGLRALAQTLRGASSTPVEVLGIDLATGNFWEEADLVTMSYVWAELEGKDRLAVLEKAFAHAKRALVIIEPGTPRHVAGLLEARAHLVSQGAHILAPCPHAAACPVKAPDWCHFSAFVPRTHLHRVVKNVSQSYELEKYAYLIVTHDAPVPTHEGRLVRAPLKRSGHVMCDVCTAGGTLERWVYTKKDKEAYQGARKKAWGETIAPPTS